MHEVGDICVCVCLCVYVYTGLIVCQKGMLVLTDLPVCLSDWRSGRNDLEDKDVCVCVHTCTRVCLKEEVSVFCERHEDVCV